MCSQQLFYLQFLSSNNLVDGHKNILAFGIMGSGDGVPVVAMLGRVCLLDEYTNKADKVLLS